MKPLYSQLLHTTANGVHHQSIEPTRHKSLQFSFSRYMQLVSVVPTDPSVLSKLGELYDSEQDKSQAFQYHFEVSMPLQTCDLPCRFIQRLLNDLSCFQSYRYFPSNIDIISWLGAYYIDSQFCEKAIHYFEKAAVIQ